MEEIICDLRYEFKMFILENKLKHFDNFNISYGKDKFHDYDIVIFDFHTNRTPKILHFAKEIRLKYCNDVLHIEAQNARECLNQVKIALLIF